MQHEKHIRERDKVAPLYHSSSSTDRKKNYVSEKKTSTPLSSPLFRTFLMKTSIFPHLFFPLQGGKVAMSHSPRSSRFSSLRSSGAAAVPISSHSAHLLLIPISSRMRHTKLFPHVQSQLVEQLINQYQLQPGMRSGECSLQQVCKRFFSVQLAPNSGFHRFHTSQCRGIRGLINSTLTGRAHLSLGMKL